MANYQTVSYPSFLRQFEIAWEPSQHVSIVGPTGSGKTWLASDIISMRKYVIAIVSKKKDDTIDQRYKQFSIATKFDPAYGERKILLWAKPKTLGDFGYQQFVFYHALSKIWDRGGWSIYFDDIFYLSETLKLRKPLQMLYTNMRSEGISLIGSLQRAAWVPKEVLSQSSHVLFLKTRSRADVLKIAECTGYDNQEILSVNAALQNRDFAWISSNELIVVKR